MLTISYSQITILFKKNHINWYAEIKFKAVILSLCMQASLYTNISEYFKKLLKNWQLGLETDISSITFGKPWQLFLFLSI